MSSHEIHHLLHHYGLLTAFAAVALQALGLPVPGGTFLVAAAVFAATAHGFSLVAVILVGALGALAGGTLGFLLGRWRGERVLLALGRLVRQKPERVQALRAQLDAHAVIALFLSRFITGARNLAGLASGASGMSFARFLAIAAAAATVWSAVVSVEYYFFGGAFLGAATWLQVLLVIAGIAATVLSLGLLRRLTRDSATGVGSPGGSE